MRSLNVYSFPLVDVRQAFSIAAVAKNAACSLFALIHNGIVLNVLPFIAYPLILKTRYLKWQGCL